MESFQTTKHTNRLTFFDFDFELFGPFGVVPFFPKRGEGRKENAFLLLNGSFRLDDQPVRWAGCGFGVGGFGLCSISSS